MVLPVIICLIKPSSPICKDEVTTVSPLVEEEDEFTQSELLNMGGGGLVIIFLLALLVWAFTKALKFKRRVAAIAEEANATELREIRRHLEDGRKSVI